MVHRIKCVLTDVSTLFPGSLIDWHGLKIKHVEKFWAELFNMFMSKRGGAPASTSVLSVKVVGNGVTNDKKTAVHTM